jgi:predicted nucleic acid-binding protein
VPERPKPTLVYADTCIYLDLITHNEDPHKDTGEPRWKIARRLFEAVNDKRVRLAASPLIEAEVLCNGETQARQERSERVADLLRTWFTSPQTLWVDIDRFIAREAARLSRECGHLREGPRRFSAADAMHLAAAIRANCDYLLTHDNGYPTKQVIEGVRVQRPAIVWAETLFEDFDFSSRKEPSVQPESD